MSCISTTSFQVLVNGELTESFQGNRGIRQGDPLSPYLFVLCMEKLSHLIQDNVEAGLWKPVKATRFGPFISHLFFADDLILFSEATPLQARVLKRSMDNFCKAFGQSINFSKSAIYCSPNTSAVTVSEISNICGSPLTDDLGKYLGMPILHTRAGKHTYASLIDKAQARLASWKSKTLNIAGRLTLIQSVTVAIPIYAMQTTKLPIHTCDKLDNINRNFLWGDTADQKRVHLVNWNEVCKPKSLGGIGLKKTKDMNQAMLAKAGWRILKNDLGLWSQIFKKKYLRNSYFPQNYHKPAACSNVWSSISHGAKLLRKGLKWRIGDGTIVKFWQDIWTNYGRLSDHACFPRHINPNALVYDFWIHNCWNILLLTEHLPPNIVQSIAAIPISQSAEPDKLIWGASSSGIFTVKSAYMLSFPEESNSPSPWHKIWKIKVPPKMKFFLWTIVNGKLQTNVQRMHRKFTSDQSCFHCPGTPETLLHLFRDCPKAKMAWNACFSTSISSYSLSLCWKEWLADNIFQNRCIFMNIPWNAIFTFICWHIWKWRCKCIFDNNFNLPADMRSLIFSYIEEWTNAIRKISKSYANLPVKLKWEKPTPGSMKINVDGSQSCNGKIGAGGVLRNHIGIWQGGFYANLGFGDILQAEIWGVLHGLHLALRHGVQIVEIESDSESAINLITNTDVSNHPLGTMIMNCRSMQALFSQCSFKHVHREKNIVVDHLAKSSLKSAPGITWLDDAPPAVAKLILEDIAGIPRLRVFPRVDYDIADDFGNGDRRETETQVNDHQRQERHADVVAVTLHRHNALMENDISNLPSTSYG